MDEACEAETVSTLTLLSVKTLWFTWNLVILWSQFEGNIFDTTNDFNHLIIYAFATIYLQLS